MNSNTTIHANFEKIHDLTVTKSGTGSGTVTSDPQGIDCGTTCSHSYDEGTSVKLTAAPAPGSTFTGWSGSGCSGSDPCTVTMDAAKDVTATFAKIRHDLTVTRSGSGSGTVTSDPAGLDCGGTCTAAFDQGTSVRLTATPTTGSTLSGWAGGGCTGTGPCTVTMDAVKNVTADFDKIETHDLSVTRSGAGSGTVTSDPQGIDCGTSCSHSYDEGTSVKLTAAPASGSTFTGWSGGGCSGTSPCTVTMDAAKSVTATFATTPTGGGGGGAGGGGAGGGTGGGGAGGGADTTAPDTTIAKRPKKKTAKRKVKVEFTSNEPGSTFTCKLNRKPPVPCTSPFKAKAKKGKNKLLVMATDPAGNSDATPGVVSWRFVPAR